jgi:hypothetical protein
MNQEFYDVLIERFLQKLDWHERQALGDRERIRVTYVEGDLKTMELARRCSLVIDPSTAILHIQAQSWAHERCLELSLDRYKEVAGSVGFRLISFNHTEGIYCAIPTKSSGG